MLIMTPLIEGFKILWYMIESQNSSTFRDFSSKMLNSQFLQFLGVERKKRRRRWGKDKMKKGKINSKEKRLRREGKKKGLEGKRRTRKALQVFCPHLFSFSNNVPVIRKARREDGSPPFWGIKLENGSVLLNTCQVEV